LRRQGKVKSYDNVDDFMRDLLSDETNWIHQAIPEAT
jgi:hypothetical protein